MGLDIEDWYLDIILPLGKRNRTYRTKHHSQLGYTGELSHYSQLGYTSELSQLLLIPTL